MNEYEREMLELYKKSLGEKQDFHGIVCPGTYKKPCRLCELCKEVLFDRNIPKEAPLRKRASSLNAKQHYFSNVVFLADPSQIVVLEYGDKIFKQLLAMQMNPDQGFMDFWHPISGRWLIIERIQGATKEQVDYYVKPKDPSKLGDMSVLSKMYDLSRITDLITEGVKPIYQSKLDKTSIVRILPSWLGPDFAMKFFQKVDYHYNISEEDFRACLAGEINPVRISGVEGQPEPPRKEVKPVGEAWKPIGTEPPMPPVLQQRQAPPKTEAEKMEEMWGKDVKPPTTPAPVVRESSPPMDDDELPPCYGDYDPSAPDCTPKECPEWSDGCRGYREEKLIKRRTAKRLTR